MGHFLKPVLYRGGEPPPMSCSWLEQEYAARKLCRKHSTMEQQEHASRKLWRRRDGATRTLSVHAALIGVLCALPGMRHLLGYEDLH
jgi:hypothetical protein